MKEAIGGISIFQIVIIFVLLFTGIMCLTINHSKAFGVKDEIITIIQNQTFGKGITTSGNKLDKSVSTEISNHLNEAGYRITGECPSSEWIGYDRNGNEVRNNASYCIKVNNVSNAYHSDLVEKCKNNKCKTTSGDYPTMIYYDVVLFYQLDIPVLNDIMNFKVYGSTKVMFG